MQRCIGYRVHSGVLVIHPEVWVIRIHRGVLIIEYTPRSMGSRGMHYTGYSKNYHVTFF